MLLGFQQSALYIAGVNRKLQEWSHGSSSRRRQGKWPQSSNRNPKQQLLETYRGPEETVTPRSLFSNQKIDIYKVLHPFTNSTRGSSAEFQSQAQEKKYFIERKHRWLMNSCSGNRKMCFVLFFFLRIKVTFRKHSTFRFRPYSQRA